MRAKFKSGDIVKVVGQEDDGRGGVPFHYIIYGQDAENNRYYMMDYREWIIAPNVHGFYNARSHELELFDTWMFGRELE